MSRWYRPVPGTWRGDDLATDLTSCGVDQAVLIPTSERDAIRAAELPRGLASRFPSSAPSADLLRSFGDKERQVELLRRHGVPVPKSWPAAALHDPSSLSEDEIARVFLKPRDSGRFSGVFGRKALHPRGRAALLHALREAERAGFEMIAQEYVPGPAANCYLIDGFVDRHGNVPGLLARQRVRQHPHDFGNSSAVRSIELGEVAEMAETLLSFLRTVGYRGIFNAEFKRDARDGTFRLFEINPRTWLYAEFAARCGFDALGMAYRDALGMRVEPNESYEVGRLAIYPYHDMLALQRLVGEGRITIAEGLRSWWGADQLHFVADDPRPGVTDAAALIPGLLGRGMNLTRPQPPGGTRHTG